LSEAIRTIIADHSSVPSDKWSYCPTSSSLGVGNGLLSRISVIEHEHQVLSTVRAPSWRNAEIPRLEVLSKSPNGASTTKGVLRQVQRRYNFSQKDLAGRYAISGSSVVDTIIKYARKNLVMRNEVFASGVKCTVGEWKITRKGKERALRECSEWAPKYSHYCLDGSSSSRV
jgi:hypothetical protein